ncbi:MAG TPA: PH domain-containing protein [Alphaproteobacteria bacterium]|nr:PH domain-containing protein [Alphaproteobacteria bacterium]HNS44036.1 PH domain-containing protein [Alphaproteobacteria bacterium]
MDPKKVVAARSSSDLPTSLREGETVLARGVISSAIFWKAGAVLLFALLIGLLAPPLGYFLCLVSLLMFIYTMILRSILMLIVTNQRIFFRSGIIKVDTVQVRLERVESVEIQRTLVGHMLNYGTVVLTGVGSRFSFIPFLANAAHIRNVIDDLLYKRDQAKEKSE